MESMLVSDMVKTVENEKVCEQSKIFRSMQAPLYIEDFVCPSVRCSVVPLFRCSVVPLFRCSVVPLFRCSAGLLVHWSIGLLFCWSVGPLVGPSSYCSKCFKVFVLSRLRTD
jgi:hypothetical protein